MSDKHPTENSTALIIGGEVKTVGLAVAGKLFVFTPNQMQFLINLQRMKEPTAAALSIGKDEEWGKKFLTSAKFKKYISCKMEEYSVKNGLTVEWWYQFGKWVTEGEKSWYDVECVYCKYLGTMNVYEVESYRADDMSLEVPCPSCCKPVTLMYRAESFKPTREQVVAWQDLGARLIPKIERVHHQFENAEIIFESDTQGGQ
jgi:hypothetical protein